MYLSQTGKLPCKSWGLPAIQTCPGAYDSLGKLVEVCRHCYADTGHYKMPRVTKRLQKNLKDWEHELFVDAMVYALRNEKYFRFFCSGDIHCVELALKILEVVTRAKQTKFWISTRAYVDTEIFRVLEVLKLQPNCCVRYSSSTFDDYKDDFHGSLVITDKSKKPKGTVLCRASQQEGKCLDCRLCWNKKIPTIAYELHRRRRKKQIKLKQLD